MWFANLREVFSSGLQALVVETWRAGPISVRNDIFRLEAAGAHV
ncbi:hypothetical protein HP15_3083 [Marinobacter adhaerens HP15]|uniref:Uncharacterized protein n=1 Tax=Marinobacter adhaerens (strain DSM 23420 / HP15) TaxID=225937 RepID=E4PPH6_MARAH|nr:hypothetical protein HP15_3083 [Marinobacter adhaerens HP15]